MNRVTMLITLVFGAAFAARAEITYTWQSYMESYDGFFTDTNHWKVGSATATEYPGQYSADETHFGDVAFFDFRGNDQDGLRPNIYFPDGVLTNFAGVSPRTTKDVVISCYGTNTTLCLPNPTVAGKSWPLYAMQWMAGATTSSRLLSFDGDRGPTTFKDFTFRLHNDSATERKVELEKGYYDFCRDSSSTALWFFQQSVSDAEKNAVVEIGAGAVVTATCYAVAINCPSVRNEVRIRGKAHFSMSVALPIRLQNVCVNSAVERQAGICVSDGGELEFGSTTRDYSAMTFGLAYDSSTQKYGSSTSIVFYVSADAGTLRQPSSTYPIYSNGPGRHRLTLENGSTGSFAGAVSLGCAAGSTGEVVVADSTATFGNAFKLGGTSAAKVAAGATGSFAATNATVAFGKSLRLYNGRISLGDKTRIVLTGDSAVVGDATYGGTRSFAADGATIAGETATALVSGFDTATVGAKGLALLTEGDQTVAQAFARASGTAGTLTLGSGGTTTLGVDVPMPVVATHVAGLTLGGHDVGGLTLGSADAATLLTLAAGEEVEIGGDLVLNGVLNVALSGTWALGTKATLNVAGDVSEASRRVWSKAVVASGLPDGMTWTTSAVSTDDGWTLTLEVVTYAPIVITQTTGSETHASNITYGVGQMLEASVAADAKTVFSGNLGYGGFTKSDGGAVELSGVNEFLRGVTLGGGLLSATTLEALGLVAGRPGLTLEDGTLWLKAGGTVPSAATIDAANGASAMVIIRNDADVTMPIPVATRGAFTKRGKGRLTFEIASDTDWTALKGNSPGSIKKEYVTWDDANGTAPTTAKHYAGVNVAEGELVLRGIGDAVPVLTQDRTAYTDVGLAGLPAAADFAQPGLVLDHVDYRQGDGTSASCFFMGSQVSPDTSGITAPYLVITNGAKLTCAAFNPCWRSEAKMAANVLLDNGTISATYQIAAVESHASKAEGPAVTNVYTLRNGSAIHSSYKEGRFYVNGWALRMDFDASRLALDANGNPLEIDFTTSDTYPASAVMALRNGSYFGVSAIKATSGGSASTAYPAITCDLTFDDSEWYVGAGNRDIPCSNLTLTVTATGGGLKLNPPAGSTWRLYTRVGGDAGIVKGGEGTLFVDNQYKLHAYQADTVTLAATGTNVVNAGTLRLKPTAVRKEPRFHLGGGTLELDAAASVLADCAVSGAGTLGTGTWQGLKVLPKFGDVLAIDGTNGATLAGKVTFDFAGDVAEAEKFQSGAVVATYTGTAPDVTKWRARRSGGHVVFTDNGEGTVSAQYARAGLMLLVR